MDFYVAVLKEILPHQRRAALQRQRRRDGHAVRVFIGGLAVALVFIALRAGVAAANPAHHPGAAATAVPATSAMAPGAPTVAPADPAPGMAPMGAPAAPPSASPVAPGMAGGGMGEMMDKMMAPANPVIPGATPAGAGSGAAPGMAGMAPPASPGGCMGGDCGAGAAKTPIYPSLMTLPALTPEKRAEIDALASQQITEGSERHAKGYESLNRARLAGDHAAMQLSVGMMREGLDELGAGIAARRVLLEGKAPRNLALDWFKREMNLASPIAREESRAFLGDAPFHILTMILLIAFALAMIAMYFFKMRRTAALFGRLEGGSGPPPPGSSPPLAGAPAAAESQPPKPST